MNIIFDFFIRFSTGDCNVSVQLIQKESSYMIIMITFLYTAEEEQHSTNIIHLIANTPFGKTNKYIHHIFT
jgi:hypothetical protein